MSKKITITVRNGVDLNSWLSLIDSNDLIKLEVETVHDEHDAKSKRTKFVVSGQSTVSVVMDGRQVGHRFGQEDAETCLRRAGYKSGSTHSVIHRLRSHGFIKTVSHGRYEVIKLVPEGYKFTDENKPSL